MSRDSKILLILVIVTLVIIGGIASFIYLQSIKDSERKEKDEFATIRDIGKEISPIPTKPDEPEEKLSPIGTKEFSRGNFLRVEGSNIIYDSDGTLVKAPFTRDEAVLACSTQDLNTATQLDHNQITNIFLLNPTEMGNKIPTSELLVVFANEVEGEYKAHTIIISSESAPCVE